MSRICYGPLGPRGQGPSGAPPTPSHTIEQAYDVCFQYNAFISTINHLLPILPPVPDDDVVTEEKDSTEPTLLFGDNEKLTAKQIEAVLTWASS